MAQLLGVLMKLELIKILEKLDSLPTGSVTSMQARKSVFELTIRGEPWWTDFASNIWEERQEQPEEQFKLLFSGLSHTRIDVAELLSFQHEELAESIIVRPLKDEKWVGGDTYNIYGSEPLPNPLALYAELSDYLTRIGAPSTASDYLNIARSISNFCEITQAPTYLISDAPSAPTKVICDELDRQGVRYTTVAFKHAMPTGLFVQIGRTSFTCQEAVIETG